MSQLSFDQFVFKVQNLDSKLMTELKKILVDSALQMERDAKLNATTYPRVRTNTLRRSITGFTKMKMGESRVFLRAGGKVEGKEVNYARYVEHGTDKMAARRYLGRAFNKELQHLSNRLSSLLSNSMGAD